MRSDMGIGLYFWQPELTIFDDPSPLYLLAADPDGPDRQRVIIPRSAGRFTDGENQPAAPLRAFLLRRFGDAMFDGPIVQMNPQAVDCVVGLDDERVELAVRVVTAAIESLPAQREELENRADALA
jgi:hypothetical protein